MTVPNPLPLQRPWSPAGYQVVQIGQEQTPLPPQSHALPGAARPVPAGPAQPWSPVGCRVVQVGHEQTRPRPRMASANPYRRDAGLALGGPLAVVGCFLGLIVLIALISSLSDGPYDYPSRGFVDVVDAPVIHQPRHPVARQVMIAIPDGAALLPVRVAADEGRPVVGKNNPGDAAAAAPLPGQETFGTAVTFARNPGEAARTAAQHSKLALVLHVSGNFEEARFT